MKKLSLIHILMALILFQFTSCMGSRPAANEDGLYVIRENMFISQIDHIFMNQRDYLGSSIKLEGNFVHNNLNGADWYFVLRNAPGCCGDDGEVGFIVTWNPESLNGPSGEERSLYPAPDEWVEATGELRSFRSPGISIIYLALSELNVLETRGADFVLR